MTILLIDTETDEFTAEAHTLDSFDSVRRVLHFHGAVGQEQTLKDALLSYADSRGIRLAEGFLVETSPYNRRRITVSAVTLNEQGLANATRRNGRWVAYKD